MHALIPADWPPSRPDATLGELADLIKEVRPEIVKAHNCKLHMSLVYARR